MKKHLIKSAESSTGYNIQFIDKNTNRRYSTDHVINQINKGNETYSDYHIVHKKNGTNYVRSNPDNSKRNNIE